MNSGFRLHWQPKRGAGRPATPTQRMALNVLFIESGEHPDARRTREQGADLVDMGDCTDFGERENPVTKGTSMLSCTFAKPVPQSLNNSEGSGQLSEVRFGSCGPLFAPTFDSRLLRCMGDCTAFTPAGEFSPNSHELRARDFCGDCVPDDFNFGESGNLGDSDTSMLRTSCCNRKEPWDFASDLSAGPLLPSGANFVRSRPAMPTFNSGRPLSRSSIAELWVSWRCARPSIVVQISDPTQPTPSCTCCKPFAASAGASHPVLTLSPCTANSCRR
mmetsp:Transcript_65003/g.174767  ORF Transcript_65003/g.174767 Transcript_65003/m.174767 type:complete len:275 (-) Transcript_65003:28-852(-)